MGAMDLSQERQPTHGIWAGRELGERIPHFTPLPPSYLQLALQGKNPTTSQRAGEPIDTVHTGRKDNQHSSSSSSSSRIEKCGLDAGTSRCLSLFNPMPKGVDFEIKIRTGVSVIVCHVTEEH